MPRVTMIDHHDTRLNKKGQPIAPPLALLFLGAALLAPVTACGSSSSPGAQHICLPAENGNGWDSCGVDPVLLTETCTLERVPANAVRAPSYSARLER